MSTLSTKARSIVKKMQQSELTESVIYEKIARFAKGEENQQTLRRLSQEEKSHYEIWKKHTGIEMKPEGFKVFWYSLMARLLGFTFAVKLMERGEEGAQAEYALLARRCPRAPRSGNRRSSTSRPCWACWTKNGCSMWAAWCWASTMLWWS